MKSTIKEFVRKSLHTIEKPFDATKAYIKRRFKWYDEVKILPFRGFGNRQRCRVWGRVLEDREIGSATQDDSFLTNIRSTLRRFLTDEVPNCRLRATLYGETHEVTTDSEGYFEIEFQEFGRKAPADQLWHDVQFRLLDKVTDQNEVESIGKVMIPPDGALFGVISDIDDTILKSSASDAFQLAKLTLIHNARTRAPVPGSAAFYRALHKGRNASDASNPVFYVSSSAWNLYDLFEEFMAFREFPQGPILLRDLGIDSMKLLKTGHDHKLERVREIMRDFSELPFVLIGDSGQQDAWLYRDVVREFPERVKAIYIHDVRESRREDVSQIAEELEADGVEMLLIENALTAAEHAAAHQMIAEEQLESIAADVGREAKNRETHSVASSGRSDSK